MDRPAAEILNSACSLERMRVQTESGRRLGRVFDLRCRWQPGAPATRIGEIIYGRLGLLERVGLVHRKPDSVPWSAVRDIRERVIVVSDDAVPAAGRR